MNSGREDLSNVVDDEVGEDSRSNHAADADRTSECEAGTTPVIRDSDAPNPAAFVDVADEGSQSGAEGSQQRFVCMDTLSQTPDVLDGADVIADGGTERSLDRVFHALSDPHRRRTLLLVSEHGPRDEDEFSIEDLAVDGDDLESLTTKLRHIHLPKLAEAGYINWDSDTQRIRRGPNFDEIAPAIRVIHEHQDQLPDGWP